MSTKKDKKEGGEKPTTDVKKKATGKKATAKKDQPSQPGISIDDVNEATGVAEKIINFPPDAPGGNGPAKKEKPPVETEPTKPVSEAEAFPPDAPIGKTEPETPTEEVKHAVEHAVEEAIEDVVEKAAEAIEHVVDDNAAKNEPGQPSPIAETAPAETPAPAEPKQPNIQEQMLEKWLNGRRSINHFELASSGVVNLNHFAMFEGIVGKFKFTRFSVGDNWQINVVE